jgi:hypothetical protein
VGVTGISLNSVTSVIRMWLLLDNRRILIGDFFVGVDKAVTGGHGGVCSFPGKIHCKAELDLCFRSQNQSSCVSTISIFQLEFFPIVA